MNEKMKNNSLTSDSYRRAKPDSFSIINRLNLTELDKQLIDCTRNQPSSAASGTESTNSNNQTISYAQLYDIARSIIAIDFDQAHQKTSVNSNDVEQDKEELELTLAKILQLCQTIIDFLLADVKRLEMDRAVPTLSQTSGDNHQNLIQENLKLRKLLQLQQKAIVYRRMTITTIATNTNNYTGSSLSLLERPINNPTNINNHLFQNGAEVADEEDNSLENLDQLPSDSKSNQTINASTTVRQSLQCLYCSKMFNNSVAFGKHLQLKHFTSSLEDPSLSLGSSLSSNLTFIQHLFQQYCQQQLQQQQLQKTLFENRSRNDEPKLQREIEFLKDKLVKTQSQLEEEKQARKTFETELKIDFQERVQSIRKELENKIKKIQLLQDQMDRKTGPKESKKNNAELDGGTSSKEVVQESEKKKNRTKQPVELNADKPAIFAKDQTENSLISSRKIVGDDTIESNENVSETKGSNINHNVENESKQEDKKKRLKQNLRDELISQLTSKREQRQQRPQQSEQNNSIKKTVKKLVDPKPAPEWIASNSNSTSSNSHLRTKQSMEESMQNIDSALNRNDPVQKINDEEKNVGNESNQGRLNQTKSEIHQSIESRIKSYMKEGDELIEMHKTNGDYDDTFRLALERLNQDRELLIHQSRHDYDFVQIEQSVRLMIDAKIRDRKSKSTPEIKSIIHDEDDEISKMKISKSSQPFSSSSSSTSIKQSEIIEPSKPTFTEASEGDHQEENDVVDEYSCKNSRRTLKSILKGRTKNAANNEMKRPEPQQSKRSITFNDEVVEFIISPLDSDNEFYDVDDHNKQNGNVASGNFTKPETRAPSNDGRNNRLSSSSSVPSSSSSLTIGDDLNFIQTTIDNRSVLGEKIYLDDSEDQSGMITSPSSSTSTSSTTSSDEEQADVDEVVRKLDDEKHLRPQSALSNLPRQKTAVNVEIFGNGRTTPREIHEDGKNLPIPAKRKNIASTSSTTTNQMDTNDTAQSSLGVQELAELIEKKLQSHSRSSLASTTPVIDENNIMERTNNHLNHNPNQKLPPLGLLDTKTMMANMKRTLDANNNKNNNHDDHGFQQTNDAKTSSNNRKHVLDAYDLYEF